MAKTSIPELERPIGSGTMAPTKPVTGSDPMA